MASFWRGSAFGDPGINPPLRGCGRWGFKRPQAAARGSSRAANAAAACWSGRMNCLSGRIRRPVEKRGLTRISHRGAGHRLGKCLSLASCSAFWGSLQDTDCAGRARACLRSSTRDDCCRRRNGHTKSSDVYLRPVESITVLFISVLSKFCCGLTCYEHPLQSTAIPHIMGGWML